MYENKLCVFYWCPSRRVINGIEWQKGFEIFLQFAINVSQYNFHKEKLLINS